VVSSRWSVVSFRNSVPRTSYLVPRTSYSLGQFFFDTVQLCFQSLIDRAVLRFHSAAATADRRVGDDFRIAASLHLAQQRNDLRAEGREVVGMQ